MKNTPSRARCRSSAGRSRAMPTQPWGEDKPKRRPVPRWRRERKNAPSQRKARGGGSRAGGCGRENAKKTQKQKPKNADPAAQLESAGVMDLSSGSLFGAVLRSRPTSSSALVDEDLPTLCDLSQAKSVTTIDGLAFGQLLSAGYAKLSVNKAHLNHINVNNTYIRPTTTAK